jgi:hypothetical protein
MAEFVQQIAAFDAKPVTFHHNVSATRLARFMPQNHFGLHRRTFGRQAVITQNC